MQHQLQPSFRIVGVGIDINDEALRDAELNEQALLPCEQVCGFCSLTWRHVDFTKLPEVNKQLCSGDELFPNTFQYYS